MKRTHTHLLAFFLIILGSLCYAQENTALACADGIDNDNDSLIDCAEPECQELSENACTICFEGITFADEMIEYIPGCSNVDPAPEGALGASDYDGSYSDSPTFVFLGQGGSIKLGFTNNILSNSGNENFDGYVFEVGPQVESSNIALRPADAYTTSQLISNNIPDTDANGYYEIGSIGGATSGFDIDAVIPDLEPLTLKFDAIEIIDVPDGGCGGTSGADIDAVCAISSITLSKANPLLVNDFKILPNPFHDKISITYNAINAEPVNYKIFNLHGQMLLQNNLEAKTEIDLSLLYTGIYHIQLTSNSQTITKKLLKL